jgi:predicted dehydrogenase
VLVGTGGYAELYVRILLDGKAGDYLRFAAVVDPYARKSALYERFKGIVPIYERMDDCYKEHAADFTIISTPIHLHYSQSATALEHGSHVLCEKPLVPSVAQLDSLAEKCRAAGKTLSVGFQQCYSGVMRSVKKRIIAGEFGKPIRLKAFISWPRDWGYYERAQWAGKLKLPNGELVRDSVFTNAVSHYMQNMLFLLGRSMGESASLDSAAVECYRANDIETFDTLALRGEASGAEVYFATTHATNYTINPAFIYEFEKAVVTANLFTFGDQLEVHHRNGVVENLGDFYSEGIENKPVYTARSILGERDFDCPIEAVRPFTLLSDKVFTQAEFNAFPDELCVKDAHARLTYIKGLHLDLVGCFNAWKLPSEAGLPWAKSPVVLK